MKLTYLSMKLEYFFDNCYNRTLRNDFLGERRGHGAAKDSVPLQGGQQGQCGNRGSAHQEGGPGG